MSKVALIDIKDLIFSHNLTPYQKRILNTFFEQNQKRDELLELYKQYYQDNIPFGKSVNQIEKQIKKIEEELK